MAARVQTAQVDSGVNTTTAAVVLPGAVTGGNAIVVQTYVGFGAVSAIAGIADALGNTYVQCSAGGTPADQTSQDGNRRVETWVALNVTGGAAPLITVTWASAQSIKGFNATEYSGFATTGAVEAVARASGASGAADPGTSSPAENNATIVATACHSSGTALTPDTGFTDVYTANIGGGVAVGSEDECQTTATSRSSFWTGPNDNWGAVAVVFKPPTSGVPPMLVGPGNLLGPGPLIGPGPLLWSE